jgi:D-sedoheptulose 7-phosphate isomerase
LDTDQEGVGSLMSKVSARFQELVTLIPQFELQAKDSILRAAESIYSTFLAGNKILICGNGGSAADSQHFAAEFVNAFSRDLDRKALPAIALSTDSSILTSIANDFNFENIFSRQVAAYGKPGDVLVTLTTSGSSKNCISAVEMAKTLKLTNIVFTKENAHISSAADIAIEVPSQNTQHIQECHMLAYHVITELVEDKLFRERTGK